MRRQSSVPWYLILAAAIGGCLAAVFVYGVTYLVITGIVAVLQWALYHVDQPYLSTLNTWMLGVIGSIIWLVLASLFRGRSSVSSKS